MIENRDIADKAIRGLAALGFSELEAAVYTTLVQKSPLTGYGVAQALGKPVANTYKAIESLRNKGAVLVDDGESRLCRAVPPSELLSRLERQFQQEKQETEQALGNIHSDTSDERIYPLQTVEQVYERARVMLEQCKEAALIDLFPEPLELLKKDLERAAERGVSLSAKVYQTVSVKGVDVVVHPRGKQTLKRWPGQWLNLVVDGSEYLLSFLTLDGSRVHQAVWSGSPYLSWIYHSGLSSEITLTSLFQLERRSQDPDIRRAIRRHRKRQFLEAAGYQTLLKTFGISPMEKNP